MRISDWSSDVCSSDLPDDPDLDRFPLYAEAARHKRVADLAPGDAIFLPPMGWHHVCSEGAVAVLVNYWFGQPADRFPFAVCAGAAARTECRSVLARQDRRAVRRIG